MTLFATLGEVISEPSDGIARKVTNVARSGCAGDEPVRRTVANDEIAG